MQRIFTGILLFGITTTSPLHAFGFIPGSNWSGSAMNWGNAPAWNSGSPMSWGNAPAWNSGSPMNWGNVPGWPTPMMNWGTPAPWNTNTNNWGNTQSWSPFNFGDNSWPTFTLPNINWQNQNIPGWNNYPPTAGNYMTNRVPAIIYQPVIPLKVAPISAAPATGAITPPLPSLPQLPTNIPQQPAIPASAALPPAPEPPIMERAITPANPQTPAEIVQAIDEKQQGVAENSTQQNGLIFPNPDDMPPEIKEITE